MISTSVGQGERRVTNFLLIFLLLRISYFTSFAAEKDSSDVSHLAKSPIGGIYREREKWWWIIINTRNLLDFGKQKSTCKKKKKQTNKQTNNYRSLLGKLRCTARRNHFIYERKKELHSFVFSKNNSYEEISLHDLSLI